MSSYVDNEFALRIFSYQRNFKQVSTMPFKLNCSCMICGDSATDRLKARFWYYEHKGTMFCHCFNCDYSMVFARFLEEQDESLYREYLLEKRKEETFGKKETPRVVETEISEKFTKKLIIERLDFCERLDRLPENHPIVKYVENRSIPKAAYKRLWFTSQWQELVNKNKPTFDNPRQECRLVIPIYNKEHKIEAYQGRALSSLARQKYMTIKAHEDASKVYGVDMVDDSKQWVYVMEGPIDSLFIPNAIAITGGSLDLDQVPYKDKRIWVLDNEPRHNDTIKRMEKLIAAGERVCFWDEAPWHSKDINDMVAKEGADPRDIEEYIVDNWAVGLLAQLRMSKYRKI
jgi:hypothetical protein